MTAETADDEVLARSFDIALKQFVAAEGKKADNPDTRGRLAARLVVLATHGEQSEERLVAEAVLYLRAFAAAVRLSVGQPKAERSAASPVAFGPDAVAAMARALEACIEALSEGGVTSTARDILHKSILEAARLGESNVTGLASYALEKLRTRA